MGNDALHRPFWPFYSSQPAPLLGFGTLIQVSFIAVQHTCTPISAEASQLCLLALFLFSANQAPFRQIWAVHQVCFCHLVAAPLAKTQFMSTVSRPYTRPFFSGLAVEAAVALARACHLVAAFLE